MKVLHLRMYLYNVLCFINNKTHMSYDNVLKLKIRSWKSHREDILVDPHGPIFLFRWSDSILDTLAILECIYEIYCEHRDQSASALEILEDFELMNVNDRLQKQVDNIKEQLRHIIEVIQSTEYFYTYAFIDKIRYDMIRKMSFLYGYIQPKMLEGLIDFIDYLKEQLDNYYFKENKLITDLMELSKLLSNNAMQYKEHEQYFYGWIFGVDNIFERNAKNLPYLQIEINKRFNPDDFKVPYFRDDAYLR